MSELKDKAFSYFSGSLSNEDYASLLAWVQASDEHLARFRAWDKEWRARETDTAAQAAWNRFEQKYTEQSTTCNLQQPKGRATYNLPRRRIVKWVAAAAACALVLVMLSNLLTTTTTTTTTLTTTTITADCREVYYLPDSTRVTLNCGSHLTYTSDFGQENRQVHLEGEGYFEVEKDQSKPFIVFADGIEVMVTGTKFNVSAYPEDEQAVVSLLEGSVQVRNHASDFKLDIVPNEKVLYTSQTGELIKRSCDAQASIAWIDGQMDYDRIRLGELLHRLSRQYETPITIQDEAINKMDVHFTMAEPLELEDILEGIADIYHLHIRHHHNEYIITCN